MNAAQVDVPSRVVVPTVYGNRVCVRQAWDAYGAVAGACIDFLEPDERSIRDMETLEPVDALKLSIMLSQYALAELSSDARMNLLADATAQLMALRPGGASIIPFPFHAPSETEPPKTDSDGDPADGAFAAPSAGSVPPPAPPQAGGEITAETAVPHSSDAPGECTCGTIIHSCRPAKYGNAVLDEMAAHDPLAAALLSQAVDEGYGWVAADDGESV